MVPPLPCPALQRNLFLAADAEAAGEPTFTYGRLHALEDVRGQRAVDAFHQLLSKGIATRPAWLR